jgi:hypothetical protein
MIKIFDNLKELIHEWLLTFSNKQSNLSSKRLERFALFSVALGASAFYLFKGVYNWEITSTDLIIVTATLFGYAGFATIQGKKDEPDKQD